MRGGRLRHVVEVLKPTTTQDASGGVVRGFTVVTKLRCRVMERGAREFERYEQAIAEVDAIIATRELKGRNAVIEADWQLRWRGVVYDIAGTFEPEGSADRETMIAARRRK